MARCLRCNKFLFFKPQSGNCPKCVLIIAEEERLRKEEEERLRKEEEECKRKAEEERVRQEEEERRRKAEEERLRQEEEERRRKAEEERLRQEEEERRRKAEEERLRQEEEERRRKAEEERLRKEEEERKRKTEKSIRFDGLYYCEKACSYFKFYQNGHVRNVSQLAADAVGFHAVASFLDKGPVDPLYGPYEGKYRQRGLNISFSVVISVGPVSTSVNHSGTIGEDGLNMSGRFGQPLFYKFIRC